MSARTFRLIWWAGMLASALTGGVSLGQGDWLYAAWGIINVVVLLAVRRGLIRQGRWA